MDYESNILAVTFGKKISIEMLKIAMKPPTVTKTSRNPPIYKLRARIGSNSGSNAQALHPF